MSAAILSLIVGIFALSISGLNSTTWFYIGSIVITGVLFAAVIGSKPRRYELARALAGAGLAFSIIGTLTHLLL